MYKLSAARTKIKNRRRELALSKGSTVVSEMFVELRNQLSYNMEGNSIGKLIT